MSSETWSGYSSTTVRLYLVGIHGTTVVPGPTTVTVVMVVDSGRPVRYAVLSTNCTSTSLSETGSGLKYRVYEGPGTSGVQGSQDDSFTTSPSLKKEY